MKRFKKAIQHVCNKSLITLMLLASFLMTTSTFAYFASDTQGSTTTTVATFQIGEFNIGTINYSIINNLTTTGYLVDMNSVLYGSSNSDVLDFDLTWNPADIPASNDEVEMNISYTMNVIYNNKTADQATIDRLMSLLTITATPANPSSIDVASGTASYTYTFSVQPNISRNDEVFLSKIDLTIIYDFTIQSI
ncbi:hypothetical protein [Candidatus Xianfuyuplasma coldseepsis]|uniref:Uncharacterized protein n=1 Tax=Candidatus Xianfuyuplasma coldseepsis TaxID=2782163 RepID=A0A7L7KTM3_9MOLU|nr:hypothetical protein [Xianfuyuplasma coldseepsis]QMS85334.1 hypothetical protein G4Z02_06060 [Xianfuyuplasma coldseepsis]